MVALLLTRMLADILADASPHCRSFPASQHGGRAGRCRCAANSSRAAQGEAQAPQADARAAAGGRRCLACSSGCRCQTSSWLCTHTLMGFRFWQLSLVVLLCVDFHRLTAACILQAVTAPLPLLQSSVGLPDVLVNLPAAFRRRYRGRGHEASDLRRLLEMYRRWQVGGAKGVWERCNVGRYGPAGPRGGAWGAWAGSQTNSAEQGR